MFRLVCATPSPPIPPPTFSTPPLPPPPTPPYLPPLPPPYPPQPPPTPPYPPYLQGRGGGATSCDIWSSFISSRSCASQASTEPATRQNHLRTAHATESLRSPFMSLNYVRIVNLCATMHGCLTCSTSSNKCHRVEESVHTQVSHFPPHPSHRCLHLVHIPLRHRDRMCLHRHQRGVLLLVHPGRVPHCGPWAQRRTPHLHCPSNCASCWHPGRSLENLAARALKALTYRPPRCLAIVLVLQAAELVFPLVSH